MSQKWGRAAAAVGQGLMAMGELNFRQKLEQERQANLERIRQENRADRKAEIADERKYNAGIMASNQAHEKSMRDEERAYQAEQDKIRRTHDAMEADKNRKSSQASAKNKSSGKSGANEKVLKASKVYAEQIKLLQSKRDQDDLPHSEEEIRELAEQRTRKIMELDETGKFPEPKPEAKVNIGKRLDGESELDFVMRMATASE